MTKTIVKFELILHLTFVPLMHPISLIYNEVKNVVINTPIVYKAQNIKIIKLLVFLNEHISKSVSLSL
jgi:hypothetical protein